MRVLLLGLLAASGLLGPACASDLALRRVMLSSAGVGYFEYDAVLDGPAALGLDVRLDQVDDVLKSLVVWDDAGAVGGIELPGRDGTHAAFGDVPFGPEALGSSLAFMNSLQGVEVSVQGPRPMTGRIVQAEATRDEPARPGGSVPVRTRVSLMTADGLRQFVLEDSEAVQVADPELRERIDRAVGASRRQSGRDARHLTIHATGAGPRTVRVSFVAAAPLWKASYRLVLPAADADPTTARARLQGWATLENATDTDWSGVALSVQYGNPVTFRQAIYRSYFVTRPEVPVEVLGRLLPDVDTGAMAEPPPPPPPAPMPASPERAAAAMKVAPGMAPPLPVAAPPPAVSAGLAVPDEVAAAQEGAEETVWPIPAPVSLAAGHSASVPILDEEIPAARVSLARPGQPHPLAAIRLTNATAASLPAGVLTFYGAPGDTPYAGDARLGGVPAGESRLLAFAQDLRTNVEWRNESSTTVAALSASGGVLRVDERTRRVVHVRLTAPAREPRRVLVEADKEDGATLASGFDRPAEETATAWRFAADLHSGEVREISFALDQDERQEIAVMDDADAVAAVLDLPGASQAARDALKRVSELRAQEAALGAERDRVQAQRAAVDEDEQRLRANLGAVGAGDALRTRLIRALDADETRHAQLDAAGVAAEEAVTRAHKALGDAVSALRL